MRRVLPLLARTTSQNIAVAGRADSRICQKLRSDELFRILSGTITHPSASEGVVAAGV